MPRDQLQLEAITTPRLQGAKGGDGFSRTQRNLGVMQEEPANRSCNQTTQCSQTTTMWERGLGKNTRTCLFSYPLISCFCLLLCVKSSREPEDKGAQDTSPEVSLPGHREGPGIDWAGDVGTWKKANTQPHCRPPPPSQDKFTDLSTPRRDWLDQTLASLQPQFSPLLFHPPASSLLCFVKFPIIS